MPTGYTYKVENGEVTDFRTFAMECARAFGACVTLRDDSNAAIPEVFEPSDYHARKIDEERAVVARFYSMTLDEAAIASAAEYEDETKRDADYLAEVEIKRERYTTMIREVQAWTPPTVEHREMKKFMLQQLNDSRDMGCSLTYHSSPERKDPAVWLADKRAEADRSLSYHSEEHAKEVKRAADRTAWVRALRGSLPAAPISP